METITAQAENIVKLRINETDIYLENKLPGQGKITISGYECNYSYAWGAMGGTLQEFLCRINKEYFASNLLGLAKAQIMDIEKTFAAIRKFIPEELDLPWYKHMRFQKDMREKLKSFQNECTNQEYMPSDIFFVQNFYSSFVNNLDYYVIKDSWDREHMEKNFKEGFSEQWNFIVNKPSREYLWLEDMHGKIKKELSKKLPEPVL